MLDSLGVREATLGAPEHLDRAVAAATSLAPVAAVGEVTSVLLLGMGTAGLAADAVAALVGDRCCVPVVVAKQYLPPAFVGPRTLVVALGAAGDTAEVTSAATAAAGAGGRLVVVAPTGSLDAVDALGPVARIGIEPTSCPVATIGAMAVHLLVMFERAGLCDGSSAQLSPAVEQLRRRRDQLAEPVNDATRLAGRIGRTFPLVYGGGPLGEVAARRWKHQFNEGPKVPSFSNAVPELTHNEVVGWAQHGDVTRQVVSLVVLRHDDEHPEVARRLELVEEVCDEVVADVHRVHAQGEGPLAQLLDLALFGQFVALRMASDAGVDPGPEPVEGEISRRAREG